ncbi:MAG: hypothetical protein ACKVKP_11520 [Acidimicrobiales bacterium]
MWSGNLINQVRRFLDDDLDAPAVRAIMLREASGKGDELGVVRAGELRAAGLLCGLDLAG